MIQFLNCMGGMGEKEILTMYEYVEKAEYAPVRKELEEVIKRTQIEMRRNYGLTFQFHLIGSGRRHLVTRIRGGNKGFDFDYNLIIPHPGNGYYYKANIIKQNFMDSFKTALQGTQYSFPKDSTSAITIKVVDKKNKQIRYGCDFAIIYYGDYNESDGYYYLRNKKKQGFYEFAFRTLNSDIEEKVTDIREYDDGWNYIRDEYLMLKNINEGNGKHSYSLYIEAVNNVYNQMFLQ